MANLQVTLNHYKGKQVLVVIAGHAAVPSVTGEVVEAGADAVCIKESNQGNERLTYIPFSAIVYFHLVA
jgi:hypothetical protein